MMSSEYPLRRDDPRAQLDPQYLDWPDLTAPVAEPPLVKQQSLKEPGEMTGNPERVVRHDIASGTTIELGDVLPPGENKGNIELDDIGGLESSDDALLLSEFNYGALSDSNELSAAPSSGVAPNSQLQSLDTTAWPLRTNAKLFIRWPNGRGTCSGTLIGYKFVLTAGHCVHDSQNGGGWAQSIEVVPGLDGSYMPFGNANAAHFVSVTGWTQDRNNDYDYALITLDRAIGYATGWTGLCSLSDSLWTNRLFDVFSYPGNHTHRILVWATDVIEAFDSTMLYSYVESAGGSSGAALMPWGLGGSYSCGITQGKSWYWGRYYSTAVRVTSSRFNQINRWIDEGTYRDEYAPNNVRWTNLGGTTYRRPTVTTSKNGRYYDLFVVGTDGAIFHNTKTTSGYIPSLTGWTRLGGYTTQAVAAVSRAPGILDVFILDRRPGSPGIYTKAWNGSAWGPSATGWWYLGGDIVSEPTVVSWGANRLDVFGRGSNGQLCI